MKENNKRLNVSMQKYLVSLCVILLFGSFIGMSGIAFGDANNSRAAGGPAPFVAPLPPLIDLKLITAYPHQNLTIYGASKEEYSGQALATGDVNNDGIDDLVIGAPLANGPSNRENCGVVYVIFGSASLPESGQRDLNNPADFDVRIWGIDPYDSCGQSVAVGNVDGQGSDDIIIGAIGGAGLGNGRWGCGEVYVIYGSGALSGTIDLNSSLTYPDVKIYGQDRWDSAGWAVAAGDVRGGSEDDIIISAIAARGPSSYLRLMSGEVYVVEGSNSLASTIDLNTTGVGPDTIIYGFDEYDMMGSSIATGHIDSTTGKEDLVIGAPQANGPNNARPYGCGEAYFIKGAVALSGSIYTNTSDPAPHADTIIYGIDGSPVLQGDQCGQSVAVGDVSGSANEDIILGAPYASGPLNARNLGGEVYIIEGATSYSSNIDLATHPTYPNVIIYGAAGGDQAGTGLAVGNLDNGTKSDIILGAPYAASGPTQNRPIAGITYIVNGSTTWPLQHKIDTNTATATAHHNTTIWGANDTDGSGKALATGDFNDDGVADLVIGANLADGVNKLRMDSGETYILYGGTISIPNLNPWMKMTDPADMATGVALNASITINFSEPMNWLTVNIQITPTVTLNANWNPNNDGVTYTHTTDFLEKQIYKVQITAGQDASGKPLIQNPGNPLIVNPWNFTTGDFTPPMVILTNPVNNSVNVDPKLNVTFTFREPMNKGSVTYSCQPTVTGGFTKFWDATNSTVTFNHSTPFQENRGYWFNITGGNDEYGLSLVNNTSMPWHVYFVTGDYTAPTITITSPVNDTTGVPVDDNITLTFSERMKTATVLFTNDGGNLLWQAGSWSPDNKTVTYGHDTNFNANTWYNITVTAGTDMANLAIVPGIVPNPFRFKTAGFGPTIVKTTPVSGTTGIALVADVVVEFSKAIQTTLVTYTCDPMPAGGFTPVWEDDMNVTYSHTIPFDTEKLYTFEITLAPDLDGNPLMGDTIPNPFNFTTRGNNPIIELTTPADDDVGIALDADVIVEFSLPMNTGTVTYTCSPNIAFTPQWNVDNDVVTYSHATEFTKNTTYTFTITAGTDSALGLPLAVNPDPDILNPWNFTTVGDEPVVTVTTPANNDVNVHLSADLIVKFSEPMNTGTVQLSCSPDPGGWATGVWNALNNEVTYKHTNPFLKNKLYTCQITAGKDLDGLNLISNALNPWSFTTAGDNPMIIETTPEDGASHVLLGADVVVEFSKSMDIDSVTISSLPSVIFTADWNLDKTIASFQHTTAFGKNQLYTFTVTAAKDQEGFDLISGNIPNPFVFTTIGDNPVIFETTPKDGSTGVALDADVIVKFNKPMNTASVTYESTPSPAGDFTSSWNTEGDMITFSHTANFIKDQAYSFEITGGKDSSGFDLVAGAIPNPWTFRTVGDEPVIFSTTPVDGKTGVGVNQKIIIDFSESMSPATVTYTITSGVGNPGGWTETWSDSDQTLTLGHTDFAPNTKYKFEITAGRDLTSKDLIAGPVPNPFEFTTGTGNVTEGPTTSLQTPADGAEVTSLKPTLTWDASDDSVEYYVYISTDKALVQSLDTSIEVDPVTDTSYTPTSDLEPGATYYWTVIPSDGTNMGTSDGVWSFTTPAKDATPTDKEDDMWWLWILIIIVIVVVVIVVVAVMMKKKEVPPEEPREEVLPPAEDAGPGAEVPPVEEAPPMPPAEEPVAEAPAEAPPIPPLEQMEAPPVEETPPALEEAPAPEAAAPAVAAPAAAAPVEAAPTEPEAPATETPPAEGEGTPETAEEPAAEGDTTTPAVCPVCSAALTPGQTACPVCGASVT